MALSRISSSAVLVVALTWADLFLRSWAKCCGAKRNINSSQLNRHLVLALHAASLHTTSVIPVTFVRLPKCRHSALNLFLLQTTQAVCAITECVRFSLNYML